ncbi:hypothetical protein P171DRAFT_131453 [Karstenula rhodostoma CBS 690.94]|uniref:DUF7587 domain-containing protein n=1 Tax=Karstenula rhodostoma CBS 690.94 TaxID=1392251 RepID=A0A9P4P648_9PLEO|nr:hypothetical protein P171DRAFT_131453 [Karstenula rhodostoma CBS 690.94]
MMPQCGRGGCMLCTGQPQPYSQVFTKACRTRRMQRYTWRVEHSGSGALFDPTTRTIKAARRFIQSPTDAEARQAVTRHLAEQPWPSPYISLSLSLMWALNYAHTKKRQGCQQIRILLIDTWGLGYNFPCRVWPASPLVNLLQIPILDLEWRGDPYHEYLVESEIPAQAILGFLDIGFVGNRFQDERLHMLFPVLSYIHPQELVPILTSLERCRQPFIDKQKYFLTREHADSAYELADELLSRGCGFTAKDHFAITVMLLSLMPRTWLGSGVVRLRVLFDNIRCPHHYRYHLSTIPIDPRMVDLLEYVVGMRCLDIAPWYRREL